MRVSTMKFQQRPDGKLRRLKLAALLAGAAIALSGCVVYPSSYGGGYGGGYYGGPAYVAPPIIVGGGWGWGGGWGRGGWR